MPNRVAIPTQIPAIPPDIIECGEAIGVHIEDPHGVVNTRIVDGNTVATIGQLAVFDGIVHMIPRHDLTTRQWWYLAAAAEEAFFNEPTEVSGWTPVVHGDQVGWATGVVVTAALIAGRCASLSMPSAALAVDPQQLGLA